MTFSFSPRGRRSGEAGDEGAFVPANPSSVHAFRVSTFSLKGRRD
jgi:hypothetical protein